MDEREGLDVLFFELASEDRLNILRELREAQLKMQDVARKLDLTATEASRQLQRLTKAKLVERLPDGTYTVSQFGKLTLLLSSSMEFVFKNRQYFLEHNVWQLPIPLLHRLGELSSGVLVTQLPESLIRMEEMVKAAEDHVWVMTPQVMPDVSRVMMERLPKGVKLRSLIHEKPLPVLKTYILDGKNVERRALSEISTGAVLTEKEAVFFLPLLNGNIDASSAFFGKDKLFLNWVSDFYLYYWNQGKEWYPNFDSNS